MFRLLFVCSGNICRSPTAEGLMRRLVKDAGLTDQVSVDSAGTEGYHVGQMPDARAIATAQDHGINLYDLVARQLRDRDFQDFDWLIAMASEHEVALHKLAPMGDADRIRKFMDFLPEDRSDDVPDPYYGPAGGFERVYALIDRGCRRILDAVQKELEARPAVATRD